MNVPPKSQWRITASSGEPRHAIDDLYATAWASEPTVASWLAIDLEEPVTLGGIEVYWGAHAAEVYGFEHSLDGQGWTPLCRTRHGEGGQNVFAFPPVTARFLRLFDPEQDTPRVLEIVEINLYSPIDAMSVREPGRLPVLGQAPVALLPGESITVDFGYVRSPLGALISWGDTWGTVFSVHLSDDGENFREMGRITTSHGDYDNFYWRSTTSRYFRLTVHATSAPAGAVINELKLRILNKDRMPIGHLERAAQAGRGELYPQALLGRQVYWTVLGEFDQAEEALLDEYGNLEPRIGSAQLTPLLRLGASLHGAPAALDLSQTLAEGSLPVPTVSWSVQELELRVTGLADAGVVQVEYRLTNVGTESRRGSLVLAIRPVQINPYWQHGGHAVVNKLTVDGANVQVNGRPYLAFTDIPDDLSLVDFDQGDVVGRIEAGPLGTDHSLESLTGLLSGAFEFSFDLAPGASTAVGAGLPLRDGVEAQATVDFVGLRDRVVRGWRRKLGPRRITLGDRETSDTVEAQIALILVNAYQSAFKPGPRNYDRTWIRDGSSQALALLWAGLIEEAKRYVLWYAKRIYPNGMVPPILNPDGTVNQGYGSDIEFDAQGEFVTIAADTYRICRDRNFLESVYEPAVRATRFIEELCARTKAQHAPDSRFYGLVAPSISHEGYNKPTYSYWDDFFALGAWRNCEYLAREIGDMAMAEEARSKGEAFAELLAQSLLMTAEAMGTDMVPASADREDVDPTSTAIAFEPCRVDDILPIDRLVATYDEYGKHLLIIRDPSFTGGFTPYEIRNLNAFVGLGRHEDAYRLLTDALGWRRPAGWRGWAEVVWGEPRAPEYIGDMPHTWIGAEFATAIRRMVLRENGATLELFRAVPDAWWEDDGIELCDLPTTFGIVQLKARRIPAGAIVELSLAEDGRLPERITVRYPGVWRALADGKTCHIQGHLVIAPIFRRLVIET